MAQHGVGLEVSVRVRTQAVPGGGADTGVRVQGEPQPGERGQFGCAVLAVQRLVGLGRDGAQQCAGAARRVEHGAGGSGEFGHEFGEAARGERVLARVGVEVPPEQELVRLPRTQPGRELGGATQERDGGEELGAGRGVHSARWAGVGVGGVHSVRGAEMSFRGVHSACRAGTGVRGVHSALAGRAETGGDHLVERGGQQGGEAFVGARAQLQPVGGAVVDEQEGAAGVHEGGDRAVGVSGELLPDAFTQRDFGEFPLVTEP